MVPLEYHEFLNVFSQKKSDEISPHGPYNYHIRLKEGTKPPYDPFYRMSCEENEELCKYLLENLDKRFIKASQSPATSPVLFV